MILIISYKLIFTHFNLQIRYKTPIVLLINLKRVLHNFNSLGCLLYTVKMYN